MRSTILHRVRAQKPRSLLRGGPVAVCFLAAAFVLVTQSSLPARAQTDGSVSQAFANAASERQVPLDVLMAIGYVESHWEQRGGAPSLDHGYGIMHLTDRRGGTLELAASLTGIPTETLKTNAGANIEGGAAVLSDISQKIKTTNAEATNTARAALWFEAVEEYSGATDRTVRDQYAREVFRAVSSGATATLSSGETVTLSAQPGKYVAQPAPPQPSSADYGPALWVPASSNNYTAGRPYGPLTYIVIHDTEGSYSSAINWFQNPSSGVSAHYVIRSSDGQITQMVRNADTAYHAGVWDYNVRAIGVEHEGYASQTGWYSEAMYQASAALVSTMADRYGIKKDRAHIIGHYQIPNQSHTDPGPNWNWDYYMSLVRHDWQSAARVDNTDYGFSASPAQIDSAHHWYVYGNGYNGSSSLATYSASDAGSSTNSASWSAYLSSAGYYDLYAFIPYVDNSTPDTTSARYQVYASSGVQTSVVSQKAITDVGKGSWAHVGKFYFDAGTARVSLSDYTGESGRNVWFDAMMWIPTSGDSAPPPQPTPTNTGVPQATSTRTSTPRPTATNTPRPTDTPEDTATPMPTWTAGPCNIRFWDLPDTHWAYNYIVNLYCRNVVSGFGDGMFRPNDTTSRAQFTKMLVLSVGWTVSTPATATFSDVPAGSPFFAYVETAHRAGVIHGYSDGTFRPGEAVTRAQALKMIMLAENWQPPSGGDTYFSDISQSYWAYGYIIGATNRGIISGYSDGTFRPQSSITRAQVAKVLTLATGQYYPKPPK